MLFNSMGTSLNNIISTPDKVALYTLDGVTLCVPIVLAVLGMLNIWNPGGLAVLGVSLGTSLINSGIQNAYAHKFQELLHSII